MHDALTMLVFLLEKYAVEAEVSGEAERTTSESGGDTGCCSLTDAMVEDVDDEAVDLRVGGLGFFDILPSPPLTSPCSFSSHILRYASKPNVEPSFSGADEAAALDLAEFLPRFETLPVRERKLVKSVRAWAERSLSRRKGGPAQSNNRSGARSSSARCRAWTRLRNRGTARHARFFE